MPNDFDPNQYIAGLQTLASPQRQEVVAESVRGLDADEKKSTILDAAKSLNTADQREVAASMKAVLAPPDGRTNDWIWILIVGAFVLVFVGTAGAMIYCQVVLVDKETAFDKLLIIFTSVVGFLVGLLSPSPVKRG
jgi:hypothetical protein